jgi:outer membrane receptor protein involved in Fe transport
MKSSRRSLSAFLIATSALIAPHALAQQADGEAGAQEVTEPVDPQEADQQTTETTTDSGDVITVLGEYIPEPLQETSEVAAFLTDEDLQRQGDSDAAAALTRVTGLSIAEGRFIYVRGLGERYSSAVLNGSPLPSPEPLQRVVPLDLFPASILRGVAVQKSYSVEYPGEFGGGVIDLSTKALPDRNFLEIGVSGGFNTETTLSTGYTYEGDELDVIGFDDGTRKTPSLLYRAISSGRRLNQQLNLDPDLTAQQELQQIGQSLENSRIRLIQENTSIPGNGSIDIAGARIFDFGDTRVGFSGLVGFSNGWKTRDGFQQEGDLSTSLNRLVVTKSFDVTTTTNEVGWDGLFDAGVQFGNHEVQLTNLYIRRTSKEASVRFGSDQFAGADIRTERTALYERELFSTQMLGKFDFGDLDVQARAGYAQTSREAPYQWELRTFFDPSINRYLYDAGSRVNNNIGFDDLTDEITSSGLDVSYAIPQSGVRDIVLSAGLSQSDNSRKSSALDFRFQNVGGALPLAMQQSRVDYLFSDFNINPNRFEIVESTDANAAYRAKLEVVGAYVKADLEPIPFLRTSFGLRGERAIETLQIIGQRPRDLKEGYYLPAATVTWNFFPDMQLKFGASQTIGRPQFRELAPQQYLDPDSDRLFIGNPFLRDTRLDNFDLRYEWFFDQSQYFAVGAFYKDIKRPVEAVVFQLSTDRVAQTYLNAPKAILQGAEIEVKKLFDQPFESGWLAGKSFLVQANYTFTDSEVQVGPGDLVFLTEGNGSPSPARSVIPDGSRLQGQSEHVANLQLGFEDEAQQGTLLVTYVSERSSARGPSGQPDYIQEPGVIMDFNYKRNFAAAGREFTFNFKAGNLLDEHYIESQNFNNSEVTINKYDLGRTFTFGLSTAF